MTDRMILMTVWRSTDRLAVRRAYVGQDKLRAARVMSPRLLSLPSSTAKVGRAGRGGWKRQGECDSIGSLVARRRPSLPPASPDSHWRCASSRRGEGLLLFGYVSSPRRFSSAQSAAAQLHSASMRWQPSMRSASLRRLKLVVAAHIGFFSEESFKAGQSGGGIAGSIGGAGSGSPGAWTGLSTAGSVGSSIGAGGRLAMAFSCPASTQRRAGGTHLISTRGELPAGTPPLARAGRAAATRDRGYLSRSGALGPRMNKGVRNGDAGR
jgi:hypothetical protein